MMKKSFLIFVILVLTFSLCASNCSAIENDIFELNIPETFSSYTENTAGEATVMQWTDLQDNSNVSVTILKNDGVSYVNLSDDEISELQTNVVEQMENDVSKTLKEYSISYVIKDSTCNVVTINNGISGVEILFDSEYLYEDGSILQAKNYMYMFSSKENIITISATVNDEDKDSLVKEMMSSFVFKEEIYIGSDEFNLDWYSVVKSAVVGGCIGGIAALIGILIKKKKSK